MEQQQFRFLLWTPTNDIGYHGLLKHFSSGRAPENPHRLFEPSERKVIFKLSKLMSVAGETVKCVFDIVTYPLSEIEGQEAYRSLRVQVDVSNLDGMFILVLGSETHPISPVCLF